MLRPFGFLQSCVETQLILPMLILLLSLAIFWCRPESTISGKSRSFFAPGAAPLKRHIDTCKATCIPWPSLQLSDLCKQGGGPWRMAGPLERGWLTKGAGFGPSNRHFSFSHSFLLNHCVHSLTKSFLFLCICSDLLMRLGLFFPRDVKYPFAAHTGLLLILENVM